VHHGRPNLRRRLHFGTTGRGDQEVHKGHVVALAQKIIIKNVLLQSKTILCIYRYCISLTFYSQKVHTAMYYYNFNMTEIP
jgi:hypothetical protein